MRRNLGQSAKRRFVERFHSDRVIGEILEVYREAIERAKERANCWQLLAGVKFEMRHGESMASIA